MGSTPPRRRPPARRKPPPRRKPPQRDRTPARVIAGASVAALLIIAVVVLSMVLGGGDDSSGSRSANAGGDPAASPTATPTATATPKAARTPRPLTAEQRDTRDQAAEIVADRGYEVTRLRDWDPRKTLQVLIGRSESGNRLAFFFIDGEYIGNDSTSSSARLTKRPGGQSTTAVLRYGIFDASDAPGKPTGDPVDVTFRWDGTRLEPSPALPAVSDRSR